MRERLERIGVAVLVAALVAWAFWQRCTLLFSEPYPMGIDGYFYAIQLRSLVESGQLYYPAAPMAFWLMAPLAAVTDPITGAKLGAAAGGALLAVPVYLLGRRLSGDRAIGLLAATLAVASTQSLYLSAEFVKTGIGLTVLATFLAVLAWALDAPSRRRIALAVAVFAATALTHKLGAVLALVFGAPVVWPHLDRRGRQLLALICGLALAVILIWQHHLLTGLLHATAHPSLPALNIRGARPLIFGYETLIAAALALACLILYAVTRRPPHPLIIGPLILTAVIAIPYLDIDDPQGLAFRLRVISFLPLGLLAAHLAGPATKQLSPQIRTAFIIGFAAGWIVSRPVTDVREGIVRTHPALQLATRAVADRVPKDGVLIVPSRQIMFMVTWYTNLPARLRPEPVPAHRRWRLLPLPLIHSSKPLLRALRRNRNHQSLHPGSPTGLILLSEATWQTLLTQIPNPDKTRLTTWPTY